MPKQVYNWGKVQLVILYPLDIKEKNQQEL